MSLVEVLVALVSTSVGLLGVAALQLVSMRTNQEAYVRVRATSLATSMLESIRANAAAFEPVEFDAWPAEDAAGGTTQYATDVRRWQSEIDRSLPGGSAIAGGAIERLENSNVVIVTVRWGSQGTNRAPGARAGDAVQMRTEL